MARNMLRIPNGYVWQPGKPVLPSVHRPLHALVGQRSWLVFHFLHAGTDWLQQPVHQWENDAEYVRIGSFIQDLSVVNDVAERCIKDITEYAEMARDSAHREKILLVVNDHREVFQDLRRDALAQLQV